MLSVKTFSYLLAFTMTYFPLSPSAKPVDTSPISPNLLSKRLDYAMHCTGRLYFTNAELSWQGLQSPSAYNYDREQWCQDTEEDGGNCVCHDDGTLTCDPASLGGQHAAPLECETPCHCLQLDPNTPDIHETEPGTCSASRNCNSASDCGSSGCNCAVFTTPGVAEYGSFSTITKLCTMNLKIKERRSLGHEIKCMCDETFASEECCG